MLFNIAESVNMKTLSQTHKQEQNVPRGRNRVSCSQHVREAEGRRRETCVSTGKRRNSRHIAADRCGRREEAEQQPTSFSQRISPAGPDAPSSSLGDREPNLNKQRRQTSRLKRAATTKLQQMIICPKNTTQSW